MVEEWSEILLSEYAEYIDMGTINYLVELIAREEKREERDT